jgi:hypothetical protein
MPRTCHNISWARRRVWGRPYKAIHHGASDSASRRSVAGFGSCALTRPRVLRFSSSVSIASFTRCSDEAISSFFSLFFCGCLALPPAIRRFCGRAASVADGARHTARRHVGSPEPQRFWRRASPEAGSCVVPRTTSGGFGPSARRASLRWNNGSVLDGRNIASGASNEKNRWYAPFALLFDRGLPGSSDVLRAPTRAAEARGAVLPLPLRGAGPVRRQGKDWSATRGRDDWIESRLWAGSQGLKSGL